MQRRVTFAALALVALLATACASSRPSADEASSAEELYDAAKDSLARGDFLSAIDTFEQLNARYPFGRFTQQGQLDIAYAYYRQSEFDNAINAADRFISLYPQSDNLDYAFYIKGLSHFSRGSSVTERLVPRDMARVDQNWLRSAYNEFDTLIRRFPESRYVDDAIDRMRYLRDEMAEHELITARFYYDRGAMVAVINRVNYLLEHFDGSVHVPNALSLLVSAYEATGQTALAADTRRVLARTAPEHPAAARSVPAG